MTYGEVNFMAWANAKIGFADRVLGMVEQKDPQLVAACRQQLPTATTIIYS